MSCLICNAETAYFLEKDGFSYQKCPSCGLVFVHPQPTEKHLREDVYSEKAGYQKHRKKIATRESAHAKKILDYLERAVPRGRLLDVGCSNGDFLFFAQRRGFDTYGVEMNGLTAKVAQERGLAVEHGALRDARYADNFFDAVFLGDIIEHVSDPRELLAECGRVLKNGGILVVSTPNLDSFWAQATYRLHTWLGMPWSVLTPPHHLFQFSEDNLKTFLKASGFAPVAVWFRRPPTLLYELGSLHMWGRFKRDKTARNVLGMIFAFTAYTCLYALDFLLTPLKKSDFGMIICSRKIKK